MKNLTETLSKIVLSLGLLLPLAAKMAHATNTPDVQMALQNIIPNSQVIYGTVTASINYGEGIAINLFYKGSSTESFVSVFASSIVAQAPYGTLDTSFGNNANGVITITSTVTIGNVCDIINSNGANYVCKLVGAIRSDASTVILLTTQTVQGGSINAPMVLNQAGGFNIPIGTTTIVSLGIIPAAFHAVVLESCRTSLAANASTVLAPNLSVYGVLRKWSANGNVSNGAVGGKDIFGSILNDSSLDFQVAASTSAIQYYPVNAAVQPAVPWLKFGQDQHVVVRAGSNGDGTAQGTLNYLECEWYEQ